MGPLRPGLAGPLDAGDQLEGPDAQRVAEAEQDAKDGRLQAAFELHEGRQ